MVEVRCLWLDNVGSAAMVDVGPIGPVLDGVGMLKVCEKASSLLFSVGSERRLFWYVRERERCHEYLKI